MANRIIPAPAPARGPLYNGAEARRFVIGPLQPDSLAGKASMAPPYASGWTMPGFQRLGLKKVKPLRGPPDIPVGTPPPTGALLETAAPPAGSQPPSPSLLGVPSTQPDIQPAPPMTTLLALLRQCLQQLQNEQRAQATQTCGQALQLAALVAPENVNRKIREVMTHMATGDPRSDYAAMDDVEEAIELVQALEE